VSGGERREGFEPWAYAAFGLAGCTAAAFLVLGLRPGGALPVFVHARGLLYLGTASALLLGAAMLWSVLRRPLLQRGRLKAFAALFASLWAASYPLAYPSSHDGHPSRTAFRLPFAETWRVVWGGDRREENALVLQPWSRYGFAFAPPEDAPAPEVLAPSAGRVLSVGETLVLEVSPTEFLVLEGLEPGGQPAAGDTLAPGAVLGRIGAEWLLVYLQDRAEARSGEGVPLRFHDYHAAHRPVPRGVPVAGQRVGPAPEPLRDPR
jgi:hypothetical protein